MRNIWEKSYSLRAGDFDKYDRIKPSSVLDLFQDAAGQHAEEIGVGFESMISRSLLWVLIKVKYRVFSQPHRYQNVKVVTWPLEPNRIIYRREFRVQDENNNILIIGSSEWVVINSKERRLVSAPDLYSFAGGFHSEHMFDDNLGRVRSFEATETPYTVNAGFCELDVNGHVNNTKYANYVLDAVSPSENEIIDCLQIDYHKEVLQGTQLNIFHSKTNNTVMAKGENQDGDLMFSCKIDFKK